MSSFGISKCFADRILVMDKGRNAEQGHREELLAANGICVCLLQMQFQE